MMMMKSVIWWRKPEYPEETTDLRQIYIIEVCGGDLVLSSEVRLSLRSESDIKASISIINAMQ